MYLDKKKGPKSLVSKALLVLYQYMTRKFFFPEVLRRRVGNSTRFQANKRKVAPKGHEVEELRKTNSFLCLFKCNTKHAILSEETENSAHFLTLIYGREPF
jgi:hypothetical protein